MQLLSCSVICKYILHYFIFFTIFVILWFKDRCSDIQKRTRQILGDECPPLLEHVCCRTRQWNDRVQAGAWTSGLRCSQQHLVLRQGQISEEAGLQHVQGQPCDSAQRVMINHLLSLYQQGLKPSNLDKLTSDLSFTFFIYILCVWDNWHWCQGQ